MVITAEYTRQPDCCVRCGVTPPRLNRHGVEDQGFIDTPIHGKAVAIKVQRKRFKCVDCGKTFQEPLPDMDEKRHMTRRLLAYIRKRSLERTFTEVSKDVGVDERTVRNIFVDYVKELNAGYAPLTPEWLGIDELYLIRKPRCVLTNVAKRTLVDVLEDRNKPTVVEWMRSKLDTKAVQIVTMDMWTGYRNAALEVMPHAKVVIDRFHVVKMANTCLDRVRKDLRDSMEAKERRKLMHDRHLILRRRKDLSAADVTRMHGWTNQLPRLREAYYAKEDFFEMYEKCATRQEALEYWDTWKGLWEPTMAGTFMELIRAVENWKPEIFNYFDFPVTNAYTEAVNGLTKVANRLGRGYSFEAIRAKMLFGIANAAGPVAPPFGDPSMWSGCMCDDRYGVGIPQLEMFYVENDE